MLSKKHQMDCNDQCSCNKGSGSNQFSPQPSLSPLTKLVSMLITPTVLTQVKGNDRNKLDEGKIAKP